MKRATRTPRGSTSTASTSCLCHFRGRGFTQVAVFDSKLFRWSVQDLEEPYEDEEKCPSLHRPKRGALCPRPPSVCLQCPGRPLGHSDPGRAIDTAAGLRAGGSTRISRPSSTIQSPSRNTAACTSSRPRRAAGRRSTPRIEPGSASRQAVGSILASCRSALKAACSGVSRPRWRTSISVSQSSRTSAAGSSHSPGNTVLRRMPSSPGASFS